MQQLCDWISFTIFSDYGVLLQSEYLCGGRYRKRVLEQQRFIKEFPAKYPVDFVEGDYEPRVFFDTVKGYEQCKEGGERCFLCYELRLKKTAQLAAEKGYDYELRLAHAAGVAPGEDMTILQPRLLSVR